MQYDFDVVIIGAGRTGLKAAHAADAAGAKVALIEADKVGGDDLWRGAIPAKTLVKSAKVFDLVKRSEEFGVHVEKPRVIWNAIKLRILDVRDEIKKIQRDELAKTKIELIMGRGTTSNEHTVSIETKSGARQITAEKILLATGSILPIPEIEGLADTGFISIGGLFERPNMPKSLIFIGSGSRLAEMAQAFARFGTKVTVLCTASTLLPDEELEVSESIARLLENEGVKISLNAIISKVEPPADSQKTVHFSVGDTSDIAKAGEIVFSTREIPDTDLTVPFVTFTDPEIARVGLTRAAAEAIHSDLQVWSTPMKTLHRAIIEGETSGFLQVVSTTDGTVLGVHIVGSSAGEFIATFVPVIRDGRQLEPGAFPYLTLSEIGNRLVS